MAYKMNCPGPVEVAAVCHLLPAGQIYMQAIILQVGRHRSRRKDQIPSLAALKDPPRESIPFAITSFIPPPQSQERFRKFLSKRCFQLV